MEFRDLAARPAEGDDGVSVARYCHSLVCIYARADSKADISRTNFTLSILMSDMRWHSGPFFGPVIPSPIDPLQTSIIHFSGYEAAAITLEIFFLRPVLGVNGDVADGLRPSVQCHCMTCGGHQVVDSICSRVYRKATARGFALWTNRSLYANSLRQTRPK